MATVVETSLTVSGLFEAEVLTELLLWRWDHPLRRDVEFRNDLLESAATALRRAISGERLFESVPAPETNLIAAIYYVEWTALSDGADDPDGARSRWLDLFRQALPSCFCAQEDLPPT